MQWQYVTIEDVKRAYHNSGGIYYFSEGAIRFFRSRFSNDAYYNKATDEYLFISSEQFVPSRGPAFPRKYTLHRMVRGDDRIFHVRDHENFQQFASLSGAKNAMQRYMKTGQL